jgi:trans-2,3-dihydro-3-hydroxyanthranilate isomerase
MRTLPYLWLDVFTDRPFAGNALCVILDGSGLSDSEMQALAKETNLSETTFVLSPTQPGATYRNRIFTPGGELAFAGHPTLGTAAALVLSGRSDGRGMVQETKSGLTQIETYSEGGRLDRVVMYAPTPVSAGRPDPEKVARALNLTAADVTPNGLQPEIIEAGVRHLIIPVTAVEGLQPDTAALVALSRELNVIGAYPFMLLGDDQTHIRARLFAPAYGISEDPATGSAAAPLGAYCYWHGLMPAGSAAFWYEQGIEMGRPSRLWVEVSEQHGSLQVHVGGQIRVVGKGEFQL